MNSKKEHRVNKKVLIKWFYNNLSGKKIGNQLDFIQSYYKNNDILIVNVEYKELINCKIELEPDKKEKLMKDFEAKSLILKNVKEITKKYITKSI